MKSLQSFKNWETSQKFDFSWNIWPFIYIGPMFLYCDNYWNWVITAFFKWNSVFHVAKVCLLPFSLFAWVTYVDNCHPALLNERYLIKEIQWLNVKFKKVTGGNIVDGLERVRRLHGDAIKAMMPKAFKESVALGVKINGLDFFFFFNENRSIQFGKEPAKESERE